MRSPAYRRASLRRAVAREPAGDLQGAAARAQYVGSPEHKDVPSFAGVPHLRADASCCPREFARQNDLVERWLRSAIAGGQVGELWEGDTVFEARLVNRQQGLYKGYPLNPEEWPAGLGERHG